MVADGESDGRPAEIDPARLEEELRQLSDTHPNVARLLLRLAAIPGSLAELEECLHNQALGRIEFLEAVVIGTVPDQEDMN
jgi:hypothetical protein